MIPPEALAAGLGLLLLLTLGVIVLLLRLPAGAARQADQARTELAVLQRSLEVSHRVEAEALRAALQASERAMTGKAEHDRMEAHAMLAGLQTQLVREQGEQRVLMEAKLREMSEQAALRLGAIQHSVNAQLAESIEKQMQGSFQRVIDQFAVVQKAMGDVQAVTSQIGDLKRIFTNVKSRGGWGEAQLRALLEDLLPEGGWEANRRLRPDSGEVVEFVLVMPAKGHPRPLLAIDSKFPAEDYNRLLLASEAGDADEERLARRALESRIRTEARTIAAKYIVENVTVDYAVMYLPSDSLYVEAARMPGLIETIGRDNRVLIVGPALLPALVRTISIGAMSLTIAENAAKIERILGGVRSEFRRMDEVFGRLEKQTGTFTRTIAETRTRTRQMEKQLKEVASLSAEETKAVLALEDAAFQEDEAP